MFSWRWVLFHLHLRIAETTRGVIVYHTYRLHMGVTNRRANEIEAAPRQILAEHIRFGRFGWDLR